jgi:hypothetical protein
MACPLNPTDICKNHPNLNYLNYACILSVYQHVISSGISAIAVNLFWLLALAPAGFVAVVTYIFYLLSCPVVLILDIFAPSLKAFAIPLTVTFILGLTRIKPLSLFSRVKS